MTDALPAPFRLLLVAIPLAAFATGLRTSEPLWLWKRRRLLVRSLLAILVVVPVVDLLLVELLQPSRLIRAGIAVSILSVGIGPPSAFRRTRARDAHVAYEVGLDVALLVLAIVYVPAAVALHGAIFDHPVRLDPAAVARVVLLQMLVPLALGMTVARLAPQMVDRVSLHAGRVAFAALLVVAVVALLVAGRSLIELGLAAWLACALAAASAILIGHVFGAADRQYRAALVAFSVLRFPGLAFLIVAQVRLGHRLIPVVLAYLLASTLLLALYAGASASRARRQRPAHLEHAA